MKEIYRRFTPLAFQLKLLPKNYSPPYAICIESESLPLFCLTGRFLASLGEP